MSPDVTIQQVIDFGSIKSVKLHTVEVLRELYVLQQNKQTKTYRFFETYVAEGKNYQNNLNNRNSTIF